MKLFTRVSRFLVLSFFITMSANSFAQELTGYADLHNHMFGNLAFAGGWFTGDPSKDKFEEVFKVCTKNEGNFFKRLIAKIDPFISSFLFRESCINPGAPFPVWNDLAHQQVWKEVLKKAHHDGLSLIVISLVHNDFLCSILPDFRKNFSSCDDMKNIDRQLDALHEFVKNNDWVELALSSSDARRIINLSKLAVVISIEVSNIFNDADWEQELAKYFSRGVRSLQPVHQVDNRFSGAAIHQVPLRWIQFYENVRKKGEWKSFHAHDEEESGFSGKRKVKKNLKGLTDEGKKLTKKMMEMKMLIDLAHLSEAAARDTYAMSQQNNNYPLFMSHGHFREMMMPPMGTFEKTSSPEIVSYIKNTSGLFGLRTASESTYPYDKSEIKNDCQGSSKSFAQAYEYGRKELQVNMALGSDLNGFIAQTKPRFAKDDPSYCPNQKEPPLGRDFDFTGLGHVGQLKDLLDDVRHMGVDLSQLEKSSELFVQMWEKVEGLRPR
jgi:microsomal dipeptidase-like Zn-dependent dipeptidase